MVSGSLRAFLDSVSKQAKLEFYVVPETIAQECFVTAFIRNLTGREALQLALSVSGLTYQQAGRSNVYVIAPRQDKKFCERIPLDHPAEGACRIAEGPPISLKCRDGALSEFSEIVFNQSDANFFFSNGAEDYLVLRQADIVLYDPVV